MKRLLSSVLLMVLMFALLAPPSLAFSDITDRDEQFAAAVLQSFGIMEGIGNDQFAPNASLTRGQFAKLATLASGFTEEQVYQSYTIFPDVKNTRWDAPYINAAVRKYGIIRGFEDGTFRPDDPVTFGQAVTILINLLGYTVADVGPYWPADYISKAAEIGLTSGVSLSANDAIPRGKAAILLSNLLLLDTKEKTPYIHTLGQATEAVLLATGASDSSIPAGKAQFYVGGTIETLTMARDIPVELVGCQGNILFHATLKGTVSGFAADTRGSTRGTVIRSYADKLELSDGIYQIARGVQLCINGKVSNYADGWFDLAPGNTVNLFYNSNGELTLISRAAVATMSNTFVYGTVRHTFADNATVLKNGAPATTKSIQNYDVVSYDNTTNTYYVSSKKIKGLYEKAAPAFSYPESITVFGNNFTVSERAATSFSKLRPGDEIVLVLDINGNVAGAYPAADVAYSQIGIMDRFSQSNLDISLLSGYKVSGIPNNLNSFETFTTGTGQTVSELALSQGRFVTVTQRPDGEIAVYPLQYNYNSSAEWDVDAGMLGNISISNSTRVYEQVTDSAPLAEISIADVSGRVIGNIRYALINSGAADAIVIGDVTGKGWDYGVYNLNRIDEIVENDRVGNYTNSYYIVTSRHFDFASTYITTLLDSKVSTGSPCAIPKGMNALEYLKSLSVFPVSRLGSASNADFDGSDGVTVGGTYVPIADDVQVYIPDSKQFISLNEARANYDRFDIYISRPVDDGGQCVMIYVY